MRYMNRKVKINGYTGECISYLPKTDEYMVRFDKPHPFRNDDWEFPESTVARSLLPFSWSDAVMGLGEFAPKIKCECGAESALNKREISPYSHAVWCMKFKRENIE